MSKKEWKIDQTLLNGHCGTAKKSQSGIESESIFAQ